MSTVTKTTSRFLDFGVLGTIRGMRFAPRGRIEGAYAGRHASRQRGGASEFVDYREYSAGEDLRRLDWKVLARTGRPYVRLYQDETELSCTLAIDASASMGFAGVEQSSGSKLEYVQFLTTAISQLILDQRDRVGLAAMQTRANEVFPPAGTPGHVVRVQEAIEKLSAAGETDLAGSLRALFPKLTRRGVLIVVSDFLVDDLDAVFAALRLFQHKRWEVTVLHVVHPEEERLPDGRAYRFEGMEGEGAEDCSPAEIRDGYAKAFEAHASAVRGSAMATGCDYARISTATPYATVLQSFLIERGG